MIKVKVTRDQSNNIINLNVSGHSGYEESGKDIVCSAVSTAMYVTVGMVQRINSNYEYIQDDDNVSMNLKINKTDEITNHVLENFIDIVSAISNDYSNYVKIINGGGIDVKD